MIVLVPKEGKAIKPTSELLYNDLQIAAKDHMDLAFKNYKNLSKVFSTPEAATKEFFDKYTPESVKKMQDAMDEWLENFKTDAVKSQFEKLVKKQMQVAFKQYEALQKRFKSPDEATREFINKHAPESTKKMMQDFDAWVEKVAPKSSRDQIQAAAKAHIDLAFNQYKQLGKIYGTPEKATKEFMDKYAPDSVNKLLEDMNKWLESVKPKPKKK